MTALAVFCASLAGGLVSVVVSLAVLWLNARRRRNGSGPLTLPARPVIPVPAPHAQPGSLSYIAHLVEQELPAHVKGAYRTTEDPRIQWDHVVVTFTQGTKGRPS